MEKESVQDSEDLKYAVHLNPIWRGKTNFIVQARLVDCEPKEFEQLWVRKVGENLYELCCIPFFLYDVALGDQFSLDQNQMLKVVQPSGRFLFRVWVEEPYAWREIVVTLDEMGCLLELYSGKLIGIDCRDWPLAEQVREILERQEAKGGLQYETGWS